MDQKIKLALVDDHNREAVLALTMREDQPFVASNDVSLRQADEANSLGETMVEVKFYDKVDDSLLKFAVIITKSDDQCSFQCS